MSDIASRLLPLLDGTQALVACYDPQDRLRYANPAFRETFFVEAGEEPTWDEIMRRNHAAGRGSRIQSDDLEGWLASVVSRRGKMASRAFESDLTDGRRLWIVESVLPDSWMLFVATEITALQTSDIDLRLDRDLFLRASQTDELTGVSNRRHVMSLLGALIEGQTASRTQQGCVCILDIDFFKRINDRHGHLGGDAILIAFARAVRSVIRLRDGFGRIGGEEFMLVMPELTLAQACVVVERVLATIREARPLAAGIAGPVTCSAGLASLRPDDTLQTVYARADRALYAAKSDGRDCCRIEA
ncbi:sensor domain-containing diguanylate cyclase [Aurantimonas sp. Leaf443]|uniref:sensor domain-containing diguanylate cyclase n=1 Tax=Aurantimonas sp. Leaf443 TaxID=1736378 RepID=UPI0006FE0066|nr:sensor domain-containing diguanylate cyclase [Aurantimonas sp. Leaf443]KQT88269.1 diguanylate cyclase [Aurantimonas sp. Leaf443]